MSFIKKLFGGGNNNQTDQGGFPQATQPQQSFGGSNVLDLKKTLNLTKEESNQLLDLRKDTFTLVLTKSGSNEVVARVALVLDKTGSFRWAYSNGTIQAIVERLLPLGLKLDDNGELDVWLFASPSGSTPAFKRLPSVTEADFYQYINREVLGKKENNFWGATSYAPVIRDVTQKYVYEEPSNYPTLVLFITDGANDDRNATKEAITEASRHGIFWQFIGVNEDEKEFDFLRRLDELKGRFVDNANFFQLNDIFEIGDEELYGRLMTEFPQWIQEAKSKGILR